jgi:hypothetical protein
LPVRPRRRSCTGRAFHNQRIDSRVVRGIDFLDFRWKTGGFRWQSSKLKPGSLFTFYEDFCCFPIASLPQTLPRRTRLLQNLLRQESFRLDPIHTK